MLVAAAGVCSLGVGALEAQASTVTYVRDGMIVAVSSYAGTPGGSTTMPGTGDTSTDSSVTGGSGTSSGGSGTGTPTAGTGGGTVRGGTFTVGTPGSGSGGTGTLAYRALGTRSLPAPVPSLVPSRAITGVRSYLRIGGATTSVFTLLDPAGTGGAIAYDCRTATSTVRWGDGSTVRTAGRGGAPRTAGAIGHVWARRGSVTVGVDSDWTCDYRFTATGATGTLTLVTSGTVTVPIDEVQPVLVR